MNEWMIIKIDGVAEIKKLAAEFDIGEINLTPWGKFKVRVYEKQNGKFVGYTNLLIKDSDGSPNGEAGFGNTVEEALKDTIRHFMDQLNNKSKCRCNEDDFEITDPFDF